MADLLTHVLVGYSLATLLSFRYEWLSPRYVTVAMAGSLIPDMNRAELFVSGRAVEAALGVPFSWGAFHTMGGSLLAVAVGALLVRPGIRVRVAALLFLGMASHHALDLLLINPSGHSYAAFWPITGYNPPTPNLYLSSDRWPAAVSGALAAGIWYVRYRSPFATGSRTEGR
ncbi:metal-dependent hydrolase [Natronorarus salvus]|uniref:metal-dependent hydrolase n=1 Tax=Natronorarus salvus TaxID=3117733 RepID=UPI002F26885F